MAGHAKTPRIASAVERHGRVPQPASASDVQRLAQEANDGTVFLVGPGIPRSAQYHALGLLQGTGAELLLYVPELERLTLGLGRDYFGLPCVPLPTNGPGRGYDFRRRLLDLVLGGLLFLLLLAPATLVFALPILLTSPGPLFFATTVVGKKGRRFTWYKFRSMRPPRPGEEARRRDAVAGAIQSPDATAGNGSTKIVDAARLTRIGRFLRRTSLDELPQFWNVLRGDMTLVGPRPCLPYEYDAYEDWQKRRLTGKGGVTGVWQVYGRSRVNFDEMVAMDICGYHRRSTRSDLRTILRTVKVMLTREGAE